MNPSSPGATRVVPKACRAGAVILVLLLVWPAAPARAAKVEFADGAHDAYGFGGGSWAAHQAPWPDRSDAAADIRGVAFENVAAGRAYSVTLTVQGAPDADHNYIPSAHFGSGCVIYHIMTPGTVARANIFCGRNYSEFRDFYQGTPVEVKGNSVTATFLYQSTRTPPAAPPAHTMTGLFAFTCRRADQLGCVWPAHLDFAEAPATAFRI